MSSIAASSPTVASPISGMEVDFDSSRAASTVLPSSPVLDVKLKLEDEGKNYKGTISESVDIPTTIEDVAAEETLESRLKGLNTLLERSSLYTAALGERMNQARVANREETNIPDSPYKNTRTGGKRGRGDTKDSPSKRKKTDETEKGLQLKQPDNIVNVTLKDYQLLGVEWLTSLYVNGVNGILADEMGLGYTLQTISFLARVPESRPALIVCPLSVLHGWMDEFRKYAPSLPVCMYHGPPDERAEIRNTMQLKENEATLAQMPAKRPPSRKKGAVGGKKRGRKSAPKEATLPKDDAEDESAVKKPENNLVVVTTYEMIIKDAKYLSRYQWNFIIVDEGHRLKNMDCKLIQEIKRYDSANRLILTGTPLHNNLAELWSLLNFILPDIFSDLDSFQAWFNLPDMQSALPSEQSAYVISKLHAILKPFLLRRLKADVDCLPPKKEYVLYAPLSERQRELYDAIVNGALRKYLIEGKQVVLQKQAAVDVNERRKLRKRQSQAKYNVDGDDDEWFDELENQVQVQDHPSKSPVEEVDPGMDYMYKNSVKQVNSMKLQNTIMQLRKVCSHPFLFDWPVDPRTQQFVVNDDLVKASGKMMILDRLLTELLARGHKVLLFSQFTTMLDIIEEWATTFKSWSICRIDGQTKPDDRRAEMHRFQTGGDDPSAPKLFLLSTRAGGLGITLTAADTVVFYDQDWNPQMDIQAQDRAHRIGQTKPVLIFRLVSAHTIETTIMKKANEKRQLEALVIAKGKFRMPGSASKSKTETIAEMAASLLKLEGEKIEVVSSSEAGKAKLISDADLDKLLDRRPEVFTDRGQGWTSGEKEGEKVDGGSGGGGGDVAFEVFQASVDQCNDSLATMLGEQVN